MKTTKQTIQDYHIEHKKRRSDSQITYLQKLIHNKQSANMKLIDENIDLQTRINKYNAKSWFSKLISVMLCNPHI